MRALPMTFSLLALAMIGCGEAPPTTPAESGAAALKKVDASSSQSELLDAVRRISARFHSEAQATKHGYVSTVACVSSPAGGMGVHWLNESLVDPVFDPLHPENVLFAPGPNGIPKLVAVEYIVINAGQQAPHVWWTGVRRRRDPGSGPALEPPRLALERQSERAVRRVQSGCLVPLRTGGLRELVT